LPLSASKPWPAGCSCRASGAAGIIKARENHPDAILLDVMMPGMDGPTTFRELRSLPETANIPVILLTAKVQAADQKRFSDLGVVKVMFKPFDPLVLAQESQQPWAGRTYEAKTLPRRSLPGCRSYGVPAGQRSSSE